MDITLLLGSGFAGALFSGIVTYIIFRKQGYLQHVTATRKDWRDEMREIAARLHGATYRQTTKILTELKVRINGYGNNLRRDDYLADAHIWKIISEIENERLEKEELTRKQEQLIEYLSVLLKGDWERSKNEICGNFFEPFSWVCIIFTGILFPVLILRTNNLEHSRLFLIAGIFLVILVILKVVLNYVYSILSKSITKKYAKSNSKRGKLLDIIMIHSFAGLEVIIPDVLFLPATKWIITLGGSGERTPNYIMILFIICTLGFGFQYVAHAIYAEKDINYIIAVNKIKEDYEKRTETGQQNVDNIT